jgi:excinuclease ABC subunit C
VPDLFLIDGGKGQLSTVSPILKGHFKNEGFGLASLAKREEEVFVPGRETPVDFRGKLKARHLLQRIRDEAHRFAVGYHRILRDKNALTSLLKVVPGIGPQRLRALYRAFESAQKVTEASREELSAVPGFNKVLAEKIHRYFHPEQD